MAMASLGLVAAISSALNRLFHKRRHRQRPIMHSRWIIFRLKPFSVASVSGILSRRRSFLTDSSYMAL